MDYKINDICNGLGIGKSTIYKRINALKENIPTSDWKRNDYFYYINNKLFITEKGYQYISSFKNNKDNSRQDSFNDVTMYQNQIIDIYKQRIEYLESENKRLLDIISIKEQKELTKDINYINNGETKSFLSKLFHKFRKY